MFDKSKHPMWGTVRFDISDWFDGEDVYIEVRDMNVEEYCTLTQARDSEADSLKAFKEILPSIIVKHNFYEEEDRQMSTEDVSDVLWQKAMLFKFILSEYLQYSFRPPKADKG